MSTPAPIPGGGENQNILTYQDQFNEAYILSKPPAWQPLYNSMGPGAPLAPPLAFADRVTLLKSLFASGASLDPFIEGGAGYVDPFTTMYIREIQGWAWVMPGTGLDQSTQVMGQGNSLPAPAGAIVTTTNIANFPKYPVPPAPAPPPTVAATKIPNPVGQRMFTTLSPLGDLYKQIVVDGCDGYNVGDTWTGTTAQGYSGTFTKVAAEAGLMICWQQTA